MAKDNTLYVVQCRDKKKTYIFFRTTYSTFSSIKNVTEKVALIEVIDTGCMQDGK